LPPLATVLDASCKGDRPSREIEQVAVDSEITQRQLKFTDLKKGNIHSANGSVTVPTKEPQERIKRCSRIRIQQRCAQSRTAHRAAPEELLLISGVTKAQLPIPTLKVIPKFAHLPAKAGVEQKVVKSSLLCSVALIVNGTIADTSRYWDRDTI